jgi:hypothetical protein
MRVYISYEALMPIECEGTPEDWDPAADDRWGDVEKDGGSGGGGRGEAMNESNGGLGNGAIVGIVVRCLVLVGALAVIACWALVYRKQTPKVEAPGERPPSEQE